MAGVNKAILIGHLGADPEIRRDTSGNPIASFSLATSETWRDKASGERKERTEWHRIVVFNENLVKLVEQYAKKGAKLYVEGQIRTRKYVGKDNIERYATEIVLANFRGEITLLESQSKRPPPAENQDAYGTTRARDSAGGPAASSKPLNAVIDDDIPF